jgi:LysM repeat protein
MTRSRISMIVAAGALVLVGLLAFALFSPDKGDAAPEATSKEKAIDKMPVPKADTAPRQVGPIVTNNSTPVPPASPPPAAPVMERKTEPVKTAPSVIDYTIKPGDMISKLAARNGVTTADIYALNPGLNDSTAAKIRAGTVIKLPTGPGAKAEEPRHVEAPKAPEGIAARVVRARAGQDAASLAREYYGSLAPVADIARANADTLGLGFRCKGGEEIILPAWGAGANSRIEHTGGEAAKPVASRDSLIPKRP